MFGPRASMSENRRRKVSTSSREASMSYAQQSEVIMAINIKGKGSLGCAYYEFAKNQLSLLHDMPSADLHHIFDVLLVHVEPTVVLLPMKMPDEAVKFFEEHMPAISNGRLPSSS
ncbi:DNA mismatch repair protein [Colletotrichum musicola]|uniref:DNA mismatch repair protein n=1 Tax=Colletotrichum musicola TaxID=2175873 RepID=A0A8H6K9Y6_9PEZI|nr:DNA mismatch repair protein [Colletotrichum musicola]